MSDRSAPDPDARHSRPTHRLRRPLTIALVLLLLGDLVVGVVANRNDRRADERDRAVEAAERIAAHDGPSVLVVGGQPTDQIVDLGGAAAAVSPEAAIEASVFAEGGVALWTAAWDHVYVRSGAIPDVVVIAFTRDQLEDQRSVDWAGIGAVYTNWGDLGDRWASAPDLNARVDITVSKLSNLVGHRRWLTSIWSGVIPSHASVPRRASDERQQEATFGQLGDLLDAIATAGSTPIIAALPTTRRYEIPDAMRTAASGRDVTIVDLQDDLPPTAFETGVPFDAPTRLLLTRRLAKAIATAMA